MYVIGLTGGIGTGKSVVAGILSEQGALILDADRLGHEVYLPDRPAYDDIVEEFGREVIAEDGTIDRKKLGPIVFADPAKLARLNAITHPRMKQMMRDVVMKDEQASHGKRAPKATGAALSPVRHGGVNCPRRAVLPAGKGRDRTLRGGVQREDPGPAKGADRLRQDALHRVHGVQAEPSGNSHPGCSRSRRRRPARPAAGNRRLS